MRNIYIIISLCFAFLLSFASCVKTEDPDAEPVVRFVRSCDPLAADRLLTEVSMGSTIAIIGEGLGGVCKIWFNDRPAQLNPAMITSTSIIVTVPGAMPQVFTNTIILETKAGKKTEYPLAVIIPSPSVDRLDCLYAPAGAELKIYGKYFFPKKETGKVDVTFPGNLSAEVKSVTENMVVCIVPENADIPGSVTVESQFGKSRSKDTWKTKEGLFCDMENPTKVWDDWNRGVFGTENGCSGQYLITKGPVGNWVWPQNQTHIYYRRPSGKPIITEGKVSDYAFQFEYFCLKWDCTPFCMWFTTFNGENIDGTEAQYHWHGYKDPDIVLGAWTTKTVPLTEFNTDKVGKETRSIKELSELVNFVAMPFGASDIATGEIDIRFDNFRLVKLVK